MSVIVKCLPIPYDLMYEIVFNLILEYLESQYINSVIPDASIWNPVAVLAVISMDMRIIVLDVSAHIFTLYMDEDIGGLIKELDHTRLIPPSRCFGLLSIGRAVQFSNDLCSTADSVAWEALRAQYAVDYMSCLHPPLRAVARLAMDVLYGIGHITVTRIACRWVKICIDNSLYMVMRRVSQELQRLIDQQWSNINSIVAVGSNALLFFNIEIESIQYDISLGFLEHYTECEIFTTTVQSTQLMDALYGYKEELAKQDPHAVRHISKNINDQIARWTPYSIILQSQEIQVVVTSAV
ncbi:hypothetical protein M422DRAFT_252140 [Sphaerobolus stellatus SS14]|uniref:Uncharacterized protein n=1 Tax=Sphaerobolus stellatus (strain SS14) TaxID=990650 RepID=A0A0C9VZK3_SPHS4|nr:hypothetical protein M422DRAFT_252140 [Sphaerobolus stellatus SS14]